MTLTSTWTPPAEISRESIVAASEDVLSREDLPIEVAEDVFRISALGLEWDIGGRVYTPVDQSRIPLGPDGKRIGIFLLHGGAGDHRGKDPMARLLAQKLGYRVVTMTFPGKLYLLDPSRDWPGDTLDLVTGTARTPLWKVDEPITPDQYELIQDRSDPVKRAKWGTLFFLRAKEGTPFYDRMAAWPAAFEEAMVAICRRHLPADDYSAYVHGHSTGGPFVHMLLQRLENVAGLVGAETSCFGTIFEKMIGFQWNFPFNQLAIRTWRHIAKYAGVEAGADGAWRLPWIMEDVLEAWDRARTQPQMKAEYFITYANDDALAEMARASAERLGLNAEETAALDERFQGYVRPLEGPGVRPLPPLLYAIAAGSRDHTLDRYQRIILPMLAEVDPPPRANVVLLQAGVHGYEKPEPDLPRGLLPAIATLWDDAIQRGYYLT